jgi:hypothetical protein
VTVQHRSIAHCRKRHSFCVTTAIGAPAISTPLDQLLNLDEKDAEPLGDIPRGSGEEVFKFAIRVGGIASPPSASPLP